MRYLMARATPTGAFRRRAEPEGLGGPLRAISQILGISLPGRPGKGHSEKVLYILKGIVAQTVRSQKISENRCKIYRVYQASPSFLISVWIMW